MEYLKASKFAIKISASLCICMAFLFILLAAEYLGFEWPGLGMREF
jgi:hypothetical protein